MPIKELKQAKRLSLKKAVKNVDRFVVGYEKLTLVLFFFETRINQTFHS